MALKQLVLGQKLATAKSNLTRVDKTLADIAKRSAEIEQALEEVTVDTPDDEKQIIYDQASEIDKEQIAAEKEKGELETTISKIESEIEEFEERSKSSHPNPSGKPQERKDNNKMSKIETRQFFGMNMEQRTRFFAEQESIDFLARTRELMKTRDSVTGSELIIPDSYLGLIRQEIPNYSKLYSKVTVRRISGTGRVTVMGDIPEGVWTEMCATLNEAEIAFYRVSLDGYKLGTYFAVCNSTLKDNDINLASELISAIAKGFAKSIDKAIIAGKGKAKNMPFGIATRLLETAVGQDHQATDKPWKNLSSSNVIVIPASKSDKALYKELIIATGKINKDYALGSITWAMNANTRTTLLANSLEVNSNGTYTAGVTGQMPLVGGSIEELNFLPDNVIAAGYYENYILTEREGTTITTSEHARFVEDETLLKGVARYDGKPVIPDAFILIGINGVTPSLDSITFPGDTANTPQTEG